MALLAAVSAAPYLRNGPVWDDHALIVEGLARLDAAGVLALLWSPVGGEVGDGYYRPLAMLLLALLGKLGVPAIHGLALAAHAASAALLERLLRPAPAAAWGAAAFAVHPLASEVLGWASALPDALAVALALGGALVARRSLAAAAALTLLGLLCKESAVLVLPFAVAAGRAPVRALGAWVGAGAVAGALRLAAGAGAAWSTTGKAGFAVDAVAWTVGAYASPWPLTAVRDLHAMPAEARWLGAAVLAALVGGALVRARRDRLAWAGVGLALAAPIIALPPVLTGYLAAERYAYVGLVGLAAWAAATLPRSPGPSRIGLAGVGTLAVLLHARLAAPWASDVALFSQATRALPDSGYAWHFLGEAHARSGDLGAAAAAFGEAVARPVSHPRDGALRLQALVLAGEGEEAWAWAQGLPEDGLTADDVAWRARAARDAGAADAARGLLALLRQPDGWDGPAWVPDLARDLGLQGAP